MLGGTFHARRLSGAPRSAVHQPDCAGVRRRPPKGGLVRVILEARAPDGPRGALLLAPPQVARRHPAGSEPRTHAAAACWPADIGLSLASTGARWLGGRPVLRRASVRRPGRYRAPIHPPCTGTSVGVGRTQSCAPLHGQSGKFFHLRGVDRHTVLSLIAPAGHSGIALVSSKHLDDLTWSALLEQAEDDPGDVFGRDECTLKSDQGGWSAGVRRQVRPPVRFRTRGRTDSTATTRARPTYSDVAFLALTIGMVRTSCSPSSSTAASLPTASGPSAVQPGVVIGPGPHAPERLASYRAQGLVDEDGATVVDLEVGKKTVEQGAPPSSSVRPVRCSTASAASTSRTTTSPFWTAQRGRRERSTSWMLRIGQVDR